MLAGLQGNRHVNYYFAVTPEILSLDRGYGCGSLISIGQWHRRDRSDNGMADEAAFVAGVVATLSASRSLLPSQVRRVSSIPGGLASEAFGGEARSGAPVMSLWIHLP
jgi:hypothetical protein